jgi:hypothetical protein
MKTTWFDKEPRLVDFIRQGAELCVRGVRRPWLTLLVALVGALLVALVLAFGKYAYAPRLVLRLEEGGGDAVAGGANVKRRLGEYVRQGIFTSEPLLALIRRHGLYPSLAAKNPRAAIESFREDIDVDVYQNYFVELREPGTTPRSARVAVSYHSPDREKALLVTRELGALIKERETRLRRDQADRAAQEAERAREALRAAVQRRSVEIAEKKNAVLATTVPDAAIQVELVGLLGSMDSLERDLEAATRRAASFQLGAALEQGGVGLSVEVVDDATLPNDARRNYWIALAAGASFLLGLPLSAMAVGAFFPRRTA